MSRAVGEAAARDPRIRCAVLPPQGGAWGEGSSYAFETGGNEPAILLLDNVAMASCALPGSKVSRLKVTIVHKVALIFTNVNIANIVLLIITSVREKP